jgi:hypothetical protein
MIIVIQGMQKGSRVGLLSSWMVPRNSGLLVRRDWSKRMLWLNLGTIFFCTSRPNQLFCWEVGSLATRKGQITSDYAGLGNNCQKMFGAKKRDETERVDVTSEDRLQVHQQEDCSCRPLEVTQEVYSAGDAKYNGG